MKPPVPNLEDHASSAKGGLDSDGDSASGSASDTDDSPEELILKVQDSIDWLHRLSNSIRNASSLGHSKRAKKFTLADPSDPEENDLTQRWIDVYSATIRREFPGLAENIRMRLAESIVLRRKRIMYRRSRQQRWALQQESHTHRTLDMIKAPQSPVVPKMTSLQGKSEIKTSAPARPGPHMNTPSLMTATTLQPERLKHVRPLSTVSSAVTSPLNIEGTAFVPPPPAAAKKDKDFVCPYCCMILPSVDGRKGHKWAQHVQKDLEPYVCLFSDCSTAEADLQIFSTSKEWLEHMRMEHCMRWHCVAGNHDPLIFLSEYDFISHMRTQHPGSFDEEDLAYVAASIGQPLEHVFDHACPFCNESPADPVAHIGNHLKYLALYTLPSFEDEDDISDKDRLSSKNSSCVKKSRTTISRPTYPVDAFGVDGSHFPDIPPEARLFDESVPDVELVDRDSEHVSERLVVWGDIPDLKFQQQHEPLNVQLIAKDKILALFWNTANPSHKIQTEWDIPTHSGISAMKRIEEISKKLELVELSAKLQLRPEMEKEVDLNLEHPGREVFLRGDLQRLSSTARSHLVDTHVILFDHYLVLAKTTAARDLKKPTPFIETVEPSVVPTMRVRDLEADEEYVMSAFERHADNCSHCADPLQVHRDEDSLCERGQQYAVDVAKYLYSENGKAKSVIDRDLDQPTLVKIPRNCSAVRGLLLAVEDGLRLPRKQPVKSVEHKSYDVSRLPIPMDLLVLESTDDGPVAESTVGGLEAVKGGSSWIDSVPEMALPENRKDDKILYPFKIKHLGKIGTYTLFAFSAQNRQEWCEKIVEAKTKYAASLFAQNAEPFSLRVLADTAFAYGDQHSGSRSVIIEGTPLDRAIREMQRKHLSSAPRPLPICRTSVCCATVFQQPTGRTMCAIGTDNGVYISDYNNARGWTRAITALRVTQIAVLEEFNLFLLLTDKSLIAYHLDVVCPVSEVSSQTLNDSARRVPQKLSGSREVGFFAVGRLEERTVVIYKKRDGLSSTFKVLEPLFQKSVDSRTRFFPVRRDQVELFRELDEFYIPAESYGINMFNSSLAISTQRGIEILTLDKKQSWAVPEFRGEAPEAQAQLSDIANRISDLRPLGMFRLSDNEFLIVYSECAVYINKHGAVSRTVIMEFVGRAHTACLYKSFLILFHEDFVEVRNAMNGGLKQVIPGHNIVCLDDGMPKPNIAQTSSGAVNLASKSCSTVKICMQNPEDEHGQIVLELMKEGQEVRFPLD